VILRKYCLRELVIPFLISLVLFTFIFMVGNLIKVADLLVNKGVSIFDVLKILALTVPSVLGFILPTGTLAAVLLVFGSFAQNNELIAMKASGINLCKVALPVVAVAFLLSLFSLFLNDQIQPRAMYLYRQLVREILVKRPTAYLEEGRFIKEFKGYILWINKVKGNRLELLFISLRRKANPRGPLWLNGAKSFRKRTTKHFRSAYTTVPATSPIRTIHPFFTNSISSLLCFLTLCLTKQAGEKERKQKK